jgi:hypothetical protein
MQCEEYYFYINRRILSFLLGALLPLLITVVEVPLIAQRHHALILRPGIECNGNSFKSEYQYLSVNLLVGLNSEFNYLKSPAIIGITGGL